LGFQLKVIQLKEKNQPVLTQQAIFNRLGIFQSQQGKARFLMKKFAALDFFRSG